MNKFFSIKKEFKKPYRILISNLILFSVYQFIGIGYILEIDIIHNLPKFIFYPGKYVELFTVIHVLICLISCFYILYINMRSKIYVHGAFQFIASFVIIIPAAFILEFIAGSISFVGYGLDQSHTLVIREFFRIYL